MYAITDYLSRVHAKERSGSNRQAKASLIRPAAAEEQSFAAWLCHLTLLCPSPLTQAVANEHRRD